jgi:hypothetical protein
MALPQVTDNAETVWLKQAKDLRSNRFIESRDSSNTRSSGSQDYPSLPKILNPEVGVTFSGGGVRSATFNLGVLQALASQGVLEKIGYVSSVSGGSYINSWLASWISKAGFQTVNQALADHEYKTQATQASTPPIGDQEIRYRAQRPIAHLRHYSSYLTPQKGILGSDVWTAVAAYLLRLLPNLIFVLLAAVALIGAPYILRNAYQTNLARDGWQFLRDSWLALDLAALAIIALYLGKRLPRYQPQKSMESRKAASQHASLTFVALLLLGPILACDGNYILQRYFFSDRVGAGSKSHLSAWVIAAGLLFLALLSAFLFGRRVGLFANNGSSARPKRALAALAWAAFFGAIAFALAAAVLALFLRIPDHHVGLALAAVFGPSLLLLAYAAMASVGVAALPYDSGSQEWLNRIWGDTAILTIMWTVIASISLLWPPLVISLQGEFKEFSALAGWPALAGWLLSTVASILSAFSSKTSGPPTADAAPVPWRIRTKTAGNRYPLENFLARISPYLFVTGLLMGISTLIDMLDRSLDGTRGVGCFEFGLAPIAGVLAIWLGSKLDVNRLSLHNFYRFRLIECYLAASRRSGAEALRLGDLDPYRGNVVRPGDWNNFDGPFPIINCTLNVTKSDSLDLQKRRARNFIFTPTHCGLTRFEDPEIKSPAGFLPSAMISSLQCASEAKPPLTLAAYQGQPLRGITLGAAMAISGAAQSPNQGSHTSPAVAALLTLANIRLGWWLGNPRNNKTFKKEGPDNGLGPMIDELLAQATDEKGYVYLSDGGHFENLGLYELIRRRCSLIILCDADCDPNYKFDDLVNAIELCRVDFGASITIDTDPLQNTLKAGWCRSAFTVGTIDYAQQDGQPKKGTLIYLKSAVTRNNSIVVHSYDRQSRHFPHEPTTNQWFDETQFEAYRLLGLETATEALKAVKRYETRKKNGNSGSADEPVFIPPLWWNTAQTEGEPWSAHAERALALLWPEALAAMKLEKAA